MAFLAPLIEGLGEAGAAGGEAGAEGAGGAGGGLGGIGQMGSMTRDFNDNPVKKIEGAVKGMIGTHGGDRAEANIGPIGTIA